jgi:hypothetical protein
MEFVLTGVEQIKNIRFYAFAEVERDARRHGFTVSVDIDILRKYRIPLQELPLLCRVFLQEQREAGADQNFVYAEDEMIKYATRREEAARVNEQRKAHRKPPPNNTEHWRKS